MKKALILFIIAINIFCFVTVMMDKTTAIQNYKLTDNQKRNRTSEVKIVTRAAFGGAVGTYVAMKSTRHKTSVQKKYLSGSIKRMIVLNIIHTVI